MRSTRKRRKLNAEINVVPYIDVMMVLLVIFMITAPMLTQGVDVELPKASAEPVDTRDEEPLIVSITADGTYHLNVGGDEREPLELAVIEERVTKILSTNAQKRVLVRGDKSVNYERVIRLMAALQGAGAPSVGLVTE